MLLEWGWLLFVDMDNDDFDGLEGSICSELNDSFEEVKCRIVQREMYS
jgi:hypothetical protein